MATAPRPRASRPQKAKKPRYEPVLELPPLPPEQYDALPSPLPLTSPAMPPLATVKPRGSQSRWRNSG